MTNEEIEVDRLFQAYRGACPEVEPCVNFMPLLWQRIEERNTFALVFGRLARPLMAASAAICLLLVLLNMMAPESRSHVVAPTYTEALAADHTAEKTSYTEAIRSIPRTDKIFQEYEQ